MAKIQDLFPTRIYRADKAGTARLNGDLEMAALSLAHDDRAGQRWCEAHGYPGYTSYSSLNDLPWRFPEFARLTKVIDVMRWPSPGPCTGTCAACARSATRCG